MRNILRIMIWKVLGNIWRRLKRIGDLALRNKYEINISDAHSSPQSVFWSIHTSPPSHYFNPLTSTRVFTPAPSFKLLDRCRLWSLLINRCSRAIFMQSVRVLPVSLHVHYCRHCPDEVTSVPLRASAGRSPAPLSCCRGYKSHCSLQQLSYL